MTKAFMTKAFMIKTLRSRLKAGVALTTICSQLALTASPASAFCGFYVAKADAKMFNKSSKVVLARIDQQTAITMASDYEGKPSEFALVVPVPTFIKKEQISVVDTKTIDHLDAYTAPRLVEYYDPDPCQRDYRGGMLALATVTPSAAIPAPPMQAYPGVKVEARYDVAEYDISILSAEQSDGLIRWLTDSGYKIPAGAEPVIGSYIKQKMHFFVAKVNIERFAAMGRAYLKPLQVRYQTSKFMLPLRLGTVNANGSQDLTIYALTWQGRVEATNYRTVKVPSNVNVPLFVAHDFPNVYKALFDRAVARQDMHGVFVEYAWDMGWCDPCAAQPLSKPELSELGANWVPGDGSNVVANRRPSSTPPSAFVTRLHVRYDAQSFPEDLNFIETSDRENFQARFVLNHPYAGAASCEAAKRYEASLPDRFKHEAENLADLTGWSQKTIAARMATGGEPSAGAN
jgi:hypothetical protein